MTKLWRRAAAILMAGLLTVGMAACSGGGNNSSTAENGGTSSSAEGGDTAEGDSVDMGDYQPVGSTDTSEVTKLVVWNTGSAETEDCNEVAAAVSDITRELIGVEVELVRGQDNDQINLALSSGEVIDLLNYNNLSGQLSTCVRNSWATALDDLVQIWGQGALEVINPTDLEANYFSGVLYSLPDQKDTSRNSGFSMRKDIVDELGITVPEVGTWDDMHDILVQVHEAYPDMYPVVSTWAGGGYQETLPIDPLDDSLGVLENIIESDSTEVVSLHATDSYREYCERMYQWNKEGLIMPDITTSTENNLLAGNGFAMIENWKPGKEYENYKSTGKEVVFMKLHEDNIKYTGCANGNSFIIPWSSENPEKAMMLWDLMYTNPEVSNLFINGIQGKHWDYTDDTETFISTPDGVDPNTSGYSSVDWSWPNQRITPVWEGNEADLWEQLEEFNTTGVVSPAMGFSWDSSSVQNQVTSVNNVISQYNNALRWGTMDPAEIDTFNAELEAAGINEIVAEKQRQLDEFLASKGDSAEDGDTSEVSSEASVVSSEAAE